MRTVTGKFYVVGESPLIHHRLSEQVIHELIWPSPPKNRNERATTMKHIPLQEFRDSFHTMPPEAPTVIGLPSAAFKAALASAAIDAGGATKAEVGRLTWIPGHRIAVYGIPEVFMTTVRQSGMVGAPDVRTRAIMTKWAAVVPISFAVPNLTEQVVAKLFAIAGMIQGVGDFRPQKGKGSFGRFRLTTEDDPEFQHLVKHCGRGAQLEAIANPAPYDSETAEYLAWFDEEVIRRGNADAIAKAAKAEKADRAAMKALGGKRSRNAPAADLHGNGSTQ
jgi:hypothetical protein